MDMNEVKTKMEDASQTIGRLQESAKNKISEVSGRVAEKSKAAASTTDAYVHEYAWSSVAVAALLGLAVGLMIRRG